MKQLKTALLVIAMVLFCAASSYALPIVGSTATLIGHGLGGGTGGGEFLFNSDGKTYITFCVEKNETIGYGNTYDIESIEDYAYKGGNGYADAGIGIESSTSDSTHDYLNSATKWLFWAYLNDTTILGYNNRTDELANHVQRSIWFLENEVTALYGDDLAFYNAYVASNPQNLSPEDRYYIPYSDSIKVMNIVTTIVDPTTGETVINRQSQIVGDPVPEPGTLLLLGLGILGLAVGGRKKFFDK